MLNTYPSDSEYYETGLPYSTRISSSSLLVNQQLTPKSPEVWFYFYDVLLYPSVQYMWGTHWSNAYALAY